MPKPRPKNNIKVKAILRIYCEGEKTEPNYINGYLGRFHNSTKLVSVEKTKKTTPKQLVEVAAKAKKDKNAFKEDEYWVVYDRESPAKYPDRIHFQALEQANAVGVNVALSNVCFEVWLLLHFNNTAASYTTCDDLLKNSSLKQEVKSLGLNGYEKGCLQLFSRLTDDHIKNARIRASAMNHNTIKSAPANISAVHLFNPYTDVYKLLDAIDDWLKPE
jgi:hypothetical protein